MTDTTPRDQLAKLIVNRDEFDGADAIIAAGWRPPAPDSEPGEGEQAEPTDAEIEAAAVEFEQHEQFWYGDDDHPRCECGFRLEESLNDSPIPSLQMHQARAALVAARTAAQR